MIQDRYELDQAGRRVVLAALQTHCAQSGWNLLAAHYVEAETRPERIMVRQKKSWVASGSGSLPSEW
jgi:hypothetical protein